MSGHEIDAVIFDGESWKVVCSCLWEAWDRTSEAEVRDAHKKHVLHETWENVRPVLKAAALTRRTGRPSEGSS